MAGDSAERLAQDPLERIGSTAAQKLHLPDEHFPLLPPGGRLLPLALHHVRRRAGNELLVAELLLLYLHQPAQPLYFRAEAAALAIDVDRVAQRHEHGGAVGEDRMAAH